MTGPQHSHHELRLYFEVLQRMTEGVSVIDASGLILYSNPAEEALFGYAPGELTGHHASVQSAYPPAEHERRITAVRDQLSRHGSWEGEWHNRRKDGSTFYSEAGVTTVDIGDVRYFVSVRRDTTGRREAEEALRASEARFSETIRASPLGIAIWNDQGVMAIANPAFLEIVGQTWEELPKNLLGWEAFTLPEYHEMERRKVRELLQYGTATPFTKEFIRPDGTRVPVLLAVSMLSTGEVACYIVDLTAQHRAEQAARALQERLHLAQRAARIGSWDWNLETGQTTWSPELYELVGRSPESTPPTPEAWFALIHPEDRTLATEHVLRSIELGQEIESEFRIVGADGRTRWLLVRADIIHDEAGNAVRMVGLNMDITARKEAEAVLRASNEDLQQFAYSASHDLREPIRMVAIYSQLLDKHFGSELGAKGSEYLRYVMQGAQRMEALVRDLLAYTQAITPGEVIHVCDANEAYGEAMANLRAAIDETDADVESGDLPVAVAAPLTSLVQIFQNLIGNAIKYRKRGTPPRVRVSGSVREGECTFTVADNGIGIAPEYHAQIFGLFKRLHSTEDYTGSGMGLAICQRIVRRLGGRIWLDSRVGEGTTFYFRLPAA